VQAEARTNKAVAVNGGLRQPASVGCCSVARIAGRKDPQFVRQNPGARSFTDAELKAIVRDLANQNDPVLQGWDGGSQVYLGLASMNQTLGDVDPEFAARQPFRDPLTRMRVGLKKSFDPASRVPERTRTLYDTPNDYFNQLKDVFEGLQGFRRPQ